MGIALWATGAVTTLLAMATAGAHSMDQVRAEFEATGRDWQARFWIEAWAAYPEDGPKVPPGDPREPGASGDEWISTLDEGDFQIMRETLGSYFKDAFVLTLAGEPLGFTTSFPTFETEPPGFEKSANGNALIRVTLSGTFPPAAGGSLALVWQSYDKEPLAIDVIIPREGKKPWRRVLRIAAGDDPIELLQVEAFGELQETREASFLLWLTAGFEHILPKGLDHILFILGLFFLQPKIRPLLSQSLAFTVAHSITLALVVLGVFTINSRFVESMIALSIAYVGIENLWVKELKPWRVAFVFALGLLHGMGFASVMMELDIPESSLVEPLVGFNLGVELGQVTVLCIAFTASVWFFKHHKFTFFRKLASGAIAATGLYWTIERAFF